VIIIQNTNLPTFAKENRDSYRLFALTFVEHTTGCILGVPHHILEWKHCLREFFSQHLVLELLSLGESREERKTGGEVAGH